MLIEIIILTIITASTPLLLAALGELVCERSGVVNLGVEGMMIMGAVCAFFVSNYTGSAFLGALSGLAIGGMLALFFAFLSVTLATNQIATGLALTLFGLGVADQIGDEFVGIPSQSLAQLDLPVLSDIPFLGPILFGQDFIFYTAIGLVFFVYWVLFKTRFGLMIRAVGDNHHSADAMGIPVAKIRYGTIIFGGACAGLAGAYLSLVYTSFWVENMTAGRGWIALALVVSAAWRPLHTFVGAYLLGAILTVQLQLQGLSLTEMEKLPEPIFEAVAFFKSIPTQFLSSLPYLATIVVLVLISRNSKFRLLHTPASLRQEFIADR